MMPEPGTPTAEIHDLTPITDPLERRHDPTERFMAALEAKERAHALKWRLRLRWLVPLLVSAIGGVYYGVTELIPPTMPADIKRDVQKAQELGEHNERQIRALGKVTVEGLDYLGRKIDKAHPEVVVVEKPESLKEAEREVSDQETDRRVDEALGLLKGDVGDGM